MKAAVPKVLLSITNAHVPEARGDSILRRAISVFVNDHRCAAVVLCVPGAWRDQFEKETSDLAGIHIVNGGLTRQESVHKGIEYLAGLGAIARNGYVLVHDAARCCVDQGVLDRVLEGVERHGAVSAAVRIVDSLCRAEGDVINTYVDRLNMWAIQTPQAFLLRDLLEAHRSAIQSGVEALDDASLVSRLRPIHLVEGDRFNIKVTEPADLPTATIIAGRSGQ